MITFLLLLFGLYFGRRLGWALSKAILYTGPVGVVIVLCLVWGLVVGALIRGLIEWRHPGIIMKILAFGVGGYVATPNYGLLMESSIPFDAQKRHLMVSGLPPLMFVIGSVALAAIYWR